jgi:hypothetical protein
MGNWRFVFENVLDMDRIGIKNFGRRIFIGWRHKGPKKEGDKYLVRGIEVRYGVGVNVRYYWGKVGHEPS